MSRISFFKATIIYCFSGEPFDGFNPVPGDMETIMVELDRDKNTLTVAVEEVRSDGKTATDK